MWPLNREVQRAQVRDGRVSALEELQRQSSARGAEAIPAPKKDNKAALLFLGPWFVGLILITAGPVLGSLVLGFTDYNLIQPPEFNGLENFSRVLTDERLHKSLSVTLIYVGVSVPLQLLCALGLALVLNKGMRGLASTAPCSTCRRCWDPVWPWLFCGGRSSAPRADQPDPRRRRYRGQGLDLRSEHGAVHADRAERVDVRAR